MVWITENYSASSDVSGCLSGSAVSGHRWENSPQSRTLSVSKITEDKLFTKRPHLFVKSQLINRGIKLNLKMIVPLCKVLVLKCSWNFLSSFVKRNSDWQRSAHVWFVIGQFKAGFVKERHPAQRSSRPTGQVPSPRKREKLFLATEFSFLFFPEFKLCPTWRAGTSFLHFLFWWRNAELRTTLKNAVETRNQTKAVQSKLISGCLKL